MNKASIKKLVTSVIIVVVVATGSYILYITKFKSKTTSQNKFITEKVTKGTMNVTVTGTGTVSSASTKDIVIPNNGALANFSVSTGSIITKGTTIANVVAPNLASQINIDTLKLNQAKQQLSQTQNQGSSQVQNDQAKITESQQKLSEDSANAKTSQSTIDSDNIAVSQAQSTLNNDTNTQNNNIANQNINIQQAQNTLNNDLSTQSSQTIVAPISGTFENVSNQNGDTVQSGKVLGTIEDLSNLQLQVPIDELDISKVQVGQSVSISFDDIKGKTFTGSVTSIPDNGTTSNNVTTYNVLVSINNPSQIKLGMNANVTINVQSKDNALMVPSEAIQTINGKKYILEANSSSKQNSYSRKNSSSSGNASNSSGKLVEVQTGLTNQTDVEITSGAADGQSVLVKLPNVSSTTSGKSGSASGKSGYGGGSSFSGGMGGSGFGGGNR
ncbi:MAG: efflux RND transporter periplasmic adaptor subunit [Clostridium sp.]|nr:efflux RND transporter periplasmic adaptor subunit [Clostridium sp.]